MDEALRRIRRQYLSTQDSLDAELYIAALERALGVAPQLHEYEIQNTLIVSTSHIPQEEAEWLGNSYYPAAFWAFKDYGWIFWIPSEMETFEIVLGRFPHNVQMLMQLAMSLDCEFLRIDADGPVYKNLPTWEW
jgi:hypothetical protein